MNSMPEPKSKTRLLLISLIGLISLLLALVIVLLAVTIAANERAKEPKEIAAQTSLPVEEEPSKTEQQEEAPNAEVPDDKTVDPQPETPGSGLLFAKNGDGTCRLLGLGDTVDACVIIPESSPDGDLVTEIAADAFYGTAGIAAIQIPSTVQFIGERAFADCRDLLYISVSEKNRFFCDVDGVLYSKDKRVLLQYPTLASSGSVKIPITVKEIREMAFYNCPYLAKIYYAGSPADWEAITVGAKNYALASAAKQFYSERGGK